MTAEPLGNPRARALAVWAQSAHITFDRQMLLGLRGRRPVLAALLGSIAAIALTYGFWLALDKVIYSIAGRVGLTEQAKVAWDTFGFEPTTPFSFLYFLTLSFAATSVIVTLALLHWGRVSHLMTYGVPFRWVEFAKGAAAWLIALFASEGLSIALYPENFHWRGFAANYPLWFALALLVILFQTFGEELFVRGYLLRLWGAALLRAWFAALLVIAFFTFIHLDSPFYAPEIAWAIVWLAASEAVFYVALFRTRSVAVTWGAHWSNNCNAFLVLMSLPGGTPGMVLSTFQDPTWAAGKSRLLSLSSWLEMVVCLGLFLLLILWRRSPFYLPPASPPPQPAEKMTAP